MKGRVALYGFGGGSGGSGAALTVNAPAGVTVTVSKDGKSKNKTANSSGIAVFKGLSTGEWTVTITDGEKTASKPVTIIADFNKSITFFSATIHVTYPAGSTCTATDGTTTLTAPDTSGTWDCVVPNAGTWTLEITNSTYTASNAVSITADGQTESVSLSYTKVLDISASKWTATSTKVTFADSGSSVAATIASANSSGIGGYLTSAVSLTNYSAVTANVTSTRNSTNGVVYKLKIYDSSMEEVASKVFYSLTKEDVTIDVSSLSGDYYIGFRLYNGTGTATFHSIKVIP